MTLPTPTQEYEQGILDAASELFNAIFSTDKKKLMPQIIVEFLMAYSKRDRWMPIESAPKTEDILLAVTRDEDGDVWSHVTQGRWIDGEDDQVDQPGHDAGFVDCDYQCFFPGRSFGNEKSQYAGTQPTHWQPLPAAPKGSE